MSFPIPISNYLFPISSDQIPKEDQFNFDFEHLAWFGFWNSITTLTTYKSRACLLSPLVFDLLREEKNVFSIPINSNILPKSSVSDILSRLLNGDCILVDSNNFSSLKSLLFTQLQNKSFDLCFPDVPDSPTKFYLTLDSISFSYFDFCEKKLHFQHFPLGIPKGIFEIFFSNCEESIKYNPCSLFPPNEIKDVESFLATLLQGKIDYSKKIPFEILQAFYFNQVLLNDIKNSFDRHQEFSSELKPRENSNTRNSNDFIPSISPPHPIRTSMHFAHIPQKYLNKKTIFPRPSIPSIPSVKAIEPNEETPQHELQVSSKETESVTKQETNEQSNLKSLSAPINPLPFKNASVYIPSKPPLQLANPTPSMNRNTLSISNQADVFQNRNLFSDVNSLKRDFSDFVNSPLFNKIKDVISDENEKKLLNELYQFNDQILEQNDALLIKNIINEKKAILSNIKAIKKLFDNQEKENQDKVSEMNEKIQLLNYELQNAKDELEKTNDLYIQKSANQEKEIEILKNENNQLKSKNLELFQENNHQKNEIEPLKVEQENLKANEKTLSLEIENLKQKNQEQSDKSSDSQLIEQYKAQINTLNQSIKDLSSQYQDSVNKWKDYCENKKNIFEEQLKTQKNNLLQKHEEEKKDFKIQLNNLQNSLQFLRANFMEISNEPGINRLRFLFLCQLQLQRKFLLESQRLKERYHHFQEINASKLNK